MNFVYFFCSDIGLIKIPSYVHVFFSDVIQPISIACSLNTDVDVIAIGNGLTHAEADDLSDTLQFAYMKTISKFKCFLSLFMVSFHKSMICAKGEENQSICKGDSGGPLIEAKSRSLVGISSFLSSHYGCGEGIAQGSLYCDKLIK